MIVWQLTLNEFLSKDLKETGDTATSFEDLLPVLLMDPCWHQRAEVPLESHPGYATAPARRAGTALSYGHQVLLKKSEYGWTPVGMYVDETVIVSDLEQRKGLATELVLRCAPHRMVPASRTVSPSGLATLKKAHRVSVERAIAAGEDVPENVRKEYKL